VAAEEQGKGIRVQGLVGLGFRVESRCWWRRRRKESGLGFRVQS